MAKGSTRQPVATVVTRLGCIIDPKCISDISHCGGNECDNCGADSSSGSDVELQRHEFIRLIHAQCNRQQRFTVLRTHKKKETSIENLVDSLSSAMAAKNAEELVAQEERERKKAEKRKAKKKRQRERKKEGKEKQADNEIKSEAVSSSKKCEKSLKSSKSASDTPSPVSLEDQEDEEEFLDPNSAFVSVVVSKKKKNTTASITNMERTKANTVRKPSENDDQVAKSEHLAILGYNMASQEQYEEAVEYFSKAIHLVHNDHRFFSNRSFCYCQLGQYQKALKDANRAISLVPTSAKGYYRKGEALKGLNQFKEAEEAFTHVLQLDEECEDAKQELENLKIQQLLEMGFAEEQAFAAIQQYETVEAAIEFLTSVGSSSRNIADSSGGDNGGTDVYFSEDETENYVDTTSSQITQHNNTKPNKMDPSNPEGHLSLWVGNVTHEVTEKQLINLFSKFGMVLSVRLLREKFCAFINFCNKTAAGPAMKSLQNFKIGGGHLVIRYPNNRVPEVHQQIIFKKTMKSPALVGSQTKVTGPVNGDECHFWRTTGCAFGSNCRYKHLKESKGIDRKPWQKTA